MRSLKKGVSGEADQFGPCCLQRWSFPALRSLCLPLFAAEHLVTARRAVSVHPGGSSSFAAIAAEVAAQQVRAIVVSSLAIHHLSSHAFLPPAPFFPQAAKGPNPSPFASASPFASEHEQHPSQMMGRSQSCNPARRRFSLCDRSAAEDEPAEE